MNVYIAGPMSDMPFFNRPAFRSAEFDLQNKGHTVLSPAILPDGLTQPQYMDICLAMLRCANAIYLLQGWEKSDGAVAEYALAKKIGLEVMLEHTL